MKITDCVTNSKQAKYRLARAIAWSMPLVLPACGIPNLRGPEPGPTLPKSFKIAAIMEDPSATSSEDTCDNSAMLSIDEFFNDPTLTGMINEALANNQELKMLGEQVQIAANQVLGRQGAFLPFVTFGTTGGIDKPSRYTRAGAVDSQLDIVPGQEFPNPLPDWLIGANLSWQVDIWRQLRNARDAAALRYLGTGEGRNYVVTRLVAEVAENYYTLMALDKRLENIENIIGLMEQSLKFAEAKKEAARETELSVQRFRAEVRKNQSEKLIVRQEIVEVENRINFLLGRFPMEVERNSEHFLELNLHALKLGVPSQLLQNRPDVVQAERDLEAAGLDIRVARARFFPTLMITGGVGYEAFNPRYLLNTPDAIVANVVGDFVGPLINKKAIRADYASANAEQLQAIYHYQRTVISAFAEVVNRVSKVENYRKSIEVKRQQVQALEASVEAATRLFTAARVEYMDVLFAQRDLRDARMVLIDTKREQLAAVVNAYQALGGGNVLQIPGWEAPKPKDAKMFDRVLRKVWNFNNRPCAHVPIIQEPIDREPDNSASDDDATAKADEPIVEKSISFEPVEHKAADEKAVDAKSTEPKPATPPAVSQTTNAPKLPGAKPRESKPTAQKGAASKAIEPKPVAPILPEEKPVDSKPADPKAVAEKIPTSAPKTK